jgi:hypothetical protein
MNLYAFFFRRSRAARAEELKLAGLAPAQLPAPLAEKLRSLNGSGAALAFRNVWRMPYSEGELYLLDFWDTRGENDSLSAQGVVVFVSRKLALPRIHVIPRIESLGWFGKFLGPLLSRLVGWGAARQGLARVSFPDEPHLEVNWVVVSDDPARARDLLSGSRGLWLLRLPAPLLWDGAGDVLCVRTWNWLSRSGTGRTLSVSQAKENALALYSILTR